MRGYPEGCRPGAQIILIGRLNGYVNDQPMGEHAPHQHAAQMDAFAVNIKQDTPVVASGEEGLRDMQYIEAIYEATRTGRRVAPGK